MAKLSKLQLISALAVVFLIALGVGLTAYVLRDTGSEQVQQNTDDQEAIMAAKAAISTRMVAAQTLSFGKVFTHWDGEVPSVCGQVDIQEEQDAFDGAERFVYSQGALFIEEIDGSDTLDQKWDDLCK
jgi:hypothetical protein